MCIAQRKHKNTKKEMLPTNYEVRSRENILTDDDFVLIWQHWTEIGGKRRDIGGQIDSQLVED